jgi:hypothetical protein
MWGEARDLDRGVKNSNFNNLYESSGISYRMIASYKKKTAERSKTFHRFYFAIHSIVENCSPILPFNVKTLQGLNV